jgi:hypothetical protein
LTITVAAPSTIIPSDRLIDWSRAGVWVNGVKGIPIYPVGITMQNTNPAGAYFIRPNDATSATATANRTAFNAAIAACPLGQAVLVPAGHYCTNGAIYINRRVVLRGAAPDTTIISCTTNTNVIEMGSSVSSSTYYNVLSGHGRGSSNLVVSSSNVGHFAVGGLVRIDQLNDPDLVTIDGPDPCTWCGRDGLNGTRAMGEVARVTGISGNTITLNRPLYYDYKSAFLPQICPMTNATPLENAGVENLHITFETAQSAGNGVQIHYSVGCWVKRCEITNFHNGGLYPRWGCLSFEARENYIHNPTSYNGGMGYAIRMWGYVCDSLIEDNIIFDCHTAIDIDTGGAGNVIAYNYAARLYPSSNVHWLLGGADSHGAHPYMNLYEGNCMEMMAFDNFHGSSSHNVVFRNYASGLSFDGYATTNLRALVIDAWQRYWSVIGNVFGVAGAGQLYEIPSPYTTDNNKVIYKIGYWGSSYPGEPRDSTTISAMILHGNYDYVHAGLVWDPQISDHNIPDSLYLTSKPAWFGVLDWPPFTPERSGFNPNNINKIPAQVRFENGLPWASSRGY